MPSEPPPLSDAELPDDPAALKARLAAMEAENAELAEEVARLKAIVAAFQRAMFGRRSEKLDADQLELALADARAGRSPRAAPRPRPQIRR
jgi:transposase